MTFFRGDIEDTELISQSGQEYNYYWGTRGKADVYPVSPSSGHAWIYGNQGGYAEATRTKDGEGA